ncbi:hypothetical protein [Halomonas sp. E19]|uniref:hypothetical protein n=1 Tax=Halomonas sp. E19 TaxID=3397247 RepID=UPI0040337DA0
MAATECTPFFPLAWRSSRPTCRREPRGGELYIFADGGSRAVSSPGMNVLIMPEHYGLLSRVLHVVAL